MQLEPPGRPVTDPFFAEVRRRHPDVDIVVLPATRPLPAAEPVADELVADARERVRARAQALWAVVAPDSPAPPLERLGHGDEPGTVRSVATVGEPREDGPSAMSLARAELERHGWEVTRPRGRVERLVARLDDLTATASWVEASRALVLTVACEPLPVGGDRAGPLVRAARGSGQR